MSILEVSNKKKIVFVAGVLVVVVALVVIVVLSREREVWPETSVACVDSSEVMYVSSVFLTILIEEQGEMLESGLPTVERVKEEIPAGIGMRSDCIAEYRTLVTGGEVELVVQHTNREPHTLGELFKVWGRPLERENKDLTVLVDGERQELIEPEDTILVDGSQVMLLYQDKRPAEEIVDDLLYGV